MSVEMNAEYMEEFRRMVRKIPVEIAPTLSAFWPIIGRAYESATTRILLVGRATNEWGDKHGLDVNAARAFGGKLLNSGPRSCSRSLDGTGSSRSGLAWRSSHAKAGSSSEAAISATHCGSSRSTRCVSPAVRSWRRSARCSGSRAEVSQVRSRARGFEIATNRPDPLTLTLRA